MNSKKWNQILKNHSDQACTQREGNTSSYLCKKDTRTLHMLFELADMLVGLAEFFLFSVKDIRDDNLEWRGEGRQYWGTKVIY